MLLYGAGGHAGVVAGIARDCGKIIKALFDDDLQKIAVAGTPVTGSYNTELFVNEPIVIAIGNNRIRRRISGQITHCFVSLIHPSALIDKTVTIGTGTVIVHGSIIQANSRIGNHVIVNTGATIDHDCEIADYVHIAPGAVLCGKVCIGESSLIGAGSCIAPNLVIGKNCIIGAGSIVTVNIPDSAVVRGNSSRVIRLNA
ncbi:acetyltransferase [Dyadobacter sediminis]|uniref:Acetyltransferase n=1 Tax=Dyadobacter sediminis TaxID=1493691 RepID=A0A5R9K7R5_9BACT|nr:acetyltransferase [Dyadobacter sediminis]TLU89910.1 acetyltransferase [Dyadobacter sediminis]GGC11835.1 acetyltransferase [Dyadobacter sediminis]